MLDLVVFGMVCVLLGVVFGSVIGWLAASHVHSIASTVSTKVQADVAALKTDAAKVAAAL